MMKDDIRVQHKLTGARGTILDLEGAHSRTVRVQWDKNNRITRTNVVDLLQVVEVPTTALELDLAVQLRDNPDLEPGVRCDGMDGPLPCCKLKGHTGPHYWRF